MSFRKILTANLLFALICIQNLLTAEEDGNWRDGQCDCGYYLSPNESATFEIKAELLCFKGFTEDLDFVTLTEYSDLQDTGFFSTDVKRRELHYKTLPCARVEFDILFPCSVWSTGARWTYLQASGKEKTINNAPIGADQKINLFDQVAGFEIDSPLTINQLSAFSKISDRITVNAIDLFVAAHLESCNCFRFKPWAGVRWVYTKDRLNDHFSQNAFYLNLQLEDTEIDHLHYQSKYNAGGIVGGIEADVDLFCGFYLNGKGVASWVYGTFRDRQKILQTHTPAVTENESIDIKGHQCVGRAITEYAFGIGWKNEFCGYIVDAKVTWEEQMFFEQQHLNTDSANAGFRGFTLSAALEF